MDSLLTLLQRLIPGSPLLVLVAFVVLVVAAQMARRLWGSVRRLGARVGALEQSRRLEQYRRYQLEATLLRDGLDLPPWPDSPQVDLVDRIDRTDEDDPAPMTTELPTQHFSRHRLRRSS
jgi:hypothetical protein